MAARIIGILMIPTAMIAELMFQNSLGEAGMRTALAVLLVVAEVGVAYAQSPSFSYPVSRQAEVVDDFFGTKVSDPYRWMEQSDSTEAAEWIAAQNRLTFAYLERLPLREHFRKRIT